MKTQARQDWEKRMIEKYGDTHSHNEEIVDLNFVTDIDGKEYEVEKYGINPCDYNCQSADDIALVLSLIKSRQ